MSSLRITGIQMMVSPKLEENLPKILDYIIHSDADIVLFPEMALTGYHKDFSDRATREAWERIAAACRQSYTMALVGTGCREEGATYIQTRIFDDEGEVLGTHEKIVPTQSDRSFCQPGHELRVFTWRELQFGCLICNDMWVTPGCGPYPDPRLSYHLAKKGASVIFHSVNSGTDADYIPYHESNLVLRARESKVYIFTANAASADGPVNCASGVVSPDGEWLIQCPREGEHVYAFDLDPEEL